MMAFSYKPDQTKAVKNFTGGDVIVLKYMTTITIYPNGQKLVKSFFVGQDKVTNHKVNEKKKAIKNKALKAKAESEKFVLSDEVKEL
jgi:hypothetical protein